MYSDRNVFYLYRYLDNCIAKNRDKYRKTEVKGRVTEDTHPGPQQWP
jgi:hypothetical protein